MRSYSKFIACLTMLTITGFAVPVVKAEEAAPKKSDTKMSAELKQNSSTTAPAALEPTTSVIPTTDTADAASSVITRVFTPEIIQWMPSSNLLPAGTQMAILEGDPAKEGPFTIRVKFPANYINAPHTHSHMEHITVISGTFNLGIGKKFDATNGMAMPAGSFVVIQPGIAHYGWGSEETVLQIQGIGPREKRFVDTIDNIANNPKTAVEPTPVISPVKASD